MSIVSTLTPLMDSARKYFGVENKLSVGNLINLFNPNPNLLRNSATWSEDIVNFSNHVVITDEKYKGYKVVHATQAWNSPQAYYHLKKGQTYTFSCYAKSDKPGGARIYTIKTGETQSTNPSSSISYQLTTDWKRYIFTFEAIKDFNCHIRLEQYNDNNLYLAGYKLEHGDLATPLTTVGGVTKLPLFAFRMGGVRHAA